MAMERLTFVLLYFAFLWNGLVDVERPKPSVLQTPGASLLRVSGALVYKGR
jgi:hypothetical protein